MVDGISKNGDSRCYIVDLKRDLDGDGRADSIVITEQEEEEDWGKKKEISFGAILTRTNGRKAVDQEFLEKNFKLKITKDDINQRNFRLTFQRDVAGKYLNFDGKTTEWWPSPKDGIPDLIQVYIERIPTVTNETYNYESSGFVISNLDGNGKATRTVMK